MGIVNVSLRKGAGQKSVLIHSLLKGVVKQIHAKKYSTRRNAKIFWGWREAIVTETMKISQLKTSIRPSSWPLCSFDDNLDFESRQVYQKNLPVSLANCRQAGIGTERQAGEEEIFAE